MAAACGGLAAGDPGRVPRPSAAAALLHAPCITLFLTCPPLCWARHGLTCRGWVSGWVGPAYSSTDPLLALETVPVGYLSAFLCVHTASYGDGAL